MESGGESGGVWVGEPEWVCGGCGGELKTGRRVLKAVNLYWHPRCLKCWLCQRKRLETYQTVAAEEGDPAAINGCVIYCGDCYEREKHPNCRACSMILARSEASVGLGNDAWHLECLICPVCLSSFTDRAYRLAPPGPIHNRPIHPGCWDRAFLDANTAVITDVRLPKPPRV